MKRNSQQLRYYFYEVVAKYRLAFKLLGHNLSKDETHQWLKEEILGLGSTEDLSPWQFWEFVESCKIFADHLFAHLGIYIRDIEEL